MHGAGRGWQPTIGATVCYVGNVAKFLALRVVPLYRPLRHRDLCIPSRHTPRTVVGRQHTSTERGKHIASTSDMDPCDRLWAELIFPWCDGQALLRLRAVCRAFLAQLNASPARLWLPLTMAVSRMRYGERLAGGAGVERAMKREEVTRGNCDAGRFTRGPVLDVDDGDDMMYVGGRIAVLCSRAVHLFDVDTGARVASIDAGSGFFLDDAVVDRWIPFLARDGRVLLLDCVAARRVEMAPADPSRDWNSFTVAGPCVAYRTSQGTDVTVVHISGGADGATIVRETARVRLASAYDRFVLCERGHSYLLHDNENDTLQLFDIATGQLKRTFTRRACSPLLVLLCDGLTDVSIIAAVPSRIDSFPFYSECDFVLARCRDDVSVVFRISGNAAVLRRAVAAR